MKKIITNQKVRVGNWVAEQIGHSTRWTSYEAIGLEQDGELVGGVVVDCYKKNVRCSVNCAGIGRKWLNRAFLFVVFDYVFRQLKCKAIVNQVNIDNADSLRFTKHLGFSEVARIHEAELVIFSMPKAQCRWLKTKD